MTERRRCPRCKATKNVSDFYKPSKGKLVPYCKPCMAEYRKEWRAKNREKVRESDRHAKRRSAYGLTQEDFEAMISAQDGRCAICRREFTETPNVDHGHLTGKVRGLLCRSCNVGLGAFLDSPALLRRAARYVILDALEQMQVRLGEELAKSEYVAPQSPFAAIDTTAVEIAARQDEPRSA